MYPNGCRPSYPIIDMQIFYNGTFQVWQALNDYQFYGFQTQKYLAGKYTVFVRAKWQANDVKDYSFRTYLPTAVTITQRKYASSAAASTDYTATTAYSCTIC